MIAGQSVLVLIPARGGSKRLPRKNVLPLGGKPLIGWSIEIARALPGVDEVLVSTDDAEIAQISRRLGASVPWLRPAQLATDKASSYDVIGHALQQFALQGQSFDILLLLQPTSPFRECELLGRALKLCIANGGAPVVGFAPARSHPSWSFTLDGEGHPHAVLDANGVMQRSQDLPPVYEVNGNFYVIGVQEFARNPTFFTDTTRALVMEDRRLGIDIDDEFDWLVAQAVASQKTEAV